MKIAPVEIKSCAAQDLGARCDECPLQGRPAIKPLPPPREARLVVLGEAPGHNEEIEGRFFVGRSGKILDRACAHFDVNRGLDLHITNAVLCRPNRKLNPTEWREAILACRGRLHRELEASGAKYVVAAGAKALLALTGKAKITPWVGAPIPGEPAKVQKKKELHPNQKLDFSGYQVLPTLHPAFCMRTPAYTPVFYTHFGRAWGLATGTLKPWRWPKMHIEVGPPMVKALKRLLKSRYPIGFDVETQGTDPLRCKVMCLGLSDGITTVSIPWRAYSSQKAGDVSGLSTYKLGGTIHKLVDRILKTKPIVLQNGQHDVLSAEFHDLEIRNYAFDTMLAHAVAAPRLRHDLGFIATCELHAPRWKTDFRVESDAKGLDVFVNRDPLRLRLYNAQDALMTARLYKPLMKRLKETYRGVEQHEQRLRLMKAAMRMQERGVQVDPSRFGVHRKYFMRRKREAYKRLQDIARRVKMKGWPQLNANSAAQLKRLFFTQLRVKPSRWSEETGLPKLDEKALRPLCSDNRALVAVAARSLLQYRRWAKLLSTYIEGLPMDGNDVVHPTLKVYGTRTGRWSSAEPNMQNIPKGSVRAGKNNVVSLRNIFVARPGHWILKADYSALEARILAVLSGDELLLDAFARGEDVHEANAKGLFRLTRKPVKRERNVAKTFLYGAAYGSDVINLWKTLALSQPDLTLTMVQRLYDMFFRQHHWIKAWQQDQIRCARENGYVECPLSGRRQYYYDGIIDPNEVLNFPVQGTGSDIIDPALLDLRARFEGTGSHVIMQVHDELVTETQNPVTAYPMVRECMERKVTLNGVTLKFPVDVEIGRDWSDVVEVGSITEVEEAMRDGG